MLFSATWVKDQSGPERDKEYTQKVKALAKSDSQVKERTNQ